MDVCVSQGMTGEWVWSEEAEDGAPRLKDDVLDHVVKRLKNMIQVPISRSPSPVFPRFTIRACVLGKTHTGKTSCLSTITTGNIIIIIIIIISTLL